MSLCDDVRAQLPLFVGGDLEAPLAARVAEHLTGQAPAGRPLAGGDRARGCPDCLAAYQQMCRVRGVLLGLGERSPAPEIDVWGDVRAVLTAEGRLAGPWAAARRTAPARKPRTGRLLVLQRLVSAAAALALLAGGWHLLQRPSDSSQALPRAGAGGGEGTRLAEQAGRAPGELILPAATGSLRRLQPGEEPLSRQARSFPDELRGWTLPPGFGPLRGGPIDPSQPTLASDRSLR